MDIDDFASAGGNCARYNDVMDNLLECLPILFFDFCRQGFGFSGKLDQSSMGF